MEIENYFNTEELPSYTEDIPQDPSTQPQEDHPSQEGPPAWFLEYFERLNAMMDCTKKHQELHER